MVICLGDGIPYAVPLEVGAVLSRDLPHGLGIVALHPGAQGWAQVKADAAKIPKLSVGTITFCLYSFVPILIGGGSHFEWDITGDRIFTRWLIEMPVDAQRLICHTSLAGVLDIGYH